MSTDRLSPLDASFLHIEDDVSHMHIASVAIFEGPQPPFADIVAMVEAKLDLVPRYRQVVKFVPFELGRPVWVDDPHFNIEYHLRHTALPAPGGETELRKLVGRVMSQQLDRSKPLWEIWVVEGLEDGRWAMLAKTHHAMVDGVAGTDLLAVIMDLSPDAVRPEPSPWAPRPVPSGAEAGAEALVNMVRSPYEQVRAARASTRALRRDGAAYACEVAGGAGRAGGPGAAHPGVEPQRPIGPHRRYAWASTSVEDIKKVRKASAGRSTTSCWPPSPTASASCCSRAARTSTGWCARWCPVSVRPRDDSGQGRGRRHLREQGVGHVRRAAGRHRGPGRSACTSSPTRWRASRTPSRPWRARR